MWRLKAGDEAVIEGGALKTVLNAVWKLSAIPPDGKRDSIATVWGARGVVGL